MANLSILEQIWNSFEFVWEISLKPKQWHGKSILI